MSKFESSLLIEKVQSYLNHYDIHPNSGCLVLGVSGGVDSMVLLNVLHQLHFQLHVIHVNYHKRGESSDLDQELVQKTCTHLGVSCEIIHWNDTNDLQKGNFQDQARSFRHHLFKTRFREQDAQAIALGHNKGDRIETILMRILRGASPSHWDGLKSYDLPIIRPLIDMDRLIIQQYAQDHHINWREDQSNLNSAYARNFLRNEVFPQLGTHFPGWDQNLERLLNFGNSYQQAIDALSYSSPMHRTPIQPLRNHPPELQSAILHRFLERNGLNPSTGQIQQLQKMIESEAGKLMIIDGITVLRDPDALTITHPEASFFDEHLSEHVIPISRILESGYEDDMMIIKQIADKDSVHTSAYLLPIPLNDFVLRDWQQGDRIAIKDGSKLISDLLNEWGIPSFQKPKAKVLTLEGKILACIFRTNDLRLMARLAPQAHIEHYPCLELYLKM